MQVLANSGQSSKKKTTRALRSRRIEGAGREAFVESLLNSQFRGLWTSTEFHVCVNARTFMYNEVLQIRFVSCQQVLSGFCKVIGIPALRLFPGPGPDTGLLQGANNQTRANPRTTNLAANYIYSFHRVCFNCFAAQKFDCYDTRYAAADRPDADSRQFISKSQ